jgi:hypothetical protein
VTVVEGLYIFLNIVNNYRCIKVFKLLVYLSTKTCIVVLLRALYTCNLLLLRVFSYFIAAAVYRVSVEFLFKLL